MKEAYPARSQKGPSATRSISPLQPLPRVGNLYLQIGACRFPAEKRASAAGVPDQDRRIARAPRGDFQWDGAAADRLGRRDHFLDRIAARIGEIERAAVAAVEKMFERPHMGIRDIAHVNVVPHAAAVRRIIVVAVDTNRLPRPRGGKHQGNEVGLRIVRFADFAVRIRPGGIEIAQCYPRQAASSIEIREHSLDEQLRGAIWIDRTLRMVLCNGNALGYAVGGAGR